MVFVRLVLTILFVLTVAYLVSKPVLWMFGLEVVRLTDLNSFLEGLIAFFVSGMSAVGLISAGAVYDEGEQLVW